MALFLLGAFSIPLDAVAQDTPLLSGGASFSTVTDSGKTSYLLGIFPVLAAPVGKHFLVESRATLLEDFFRPSPGQGYDSIHFVGLDYLQVDYLATSHLTIVGGHFLTPFGTYNERLAPGWIGNFQDVPLIFSIGTMGGGSSTGGMLRGSAVSTPNFSIDYAAYFSSKVTNEQFQSSRSAGGKVEAYFPKLRLEIGTSYGRLLEGTRTNSYGVHVWWEPAKSPFKLRSEYAHGAHAEGYWVEADYRLSKFGGPESLIGRLEPVFRWQQVFRNSPDPKDGLPAANTRQTDCGFDYHLPHEVRINTSFSRQFSATGNHNVWETSIVYRFLFPAWKGKQ